MALVVVVEPNYSRHSLFRVHGVVVASAGAEPLVRESNCPTIPVEPFGNRAKIRAPRRPFVGNNCNEQSCKHELNCRQIANHSPRVLLPRENGDDDEQASQLQHVPDYSSYE